MPRPTEENLFKDTTMTFGEHLEELRICLFKSLLGLTVGFLIGLYFADSVVETIQGPVREALGAYYKSQAPEKLKEHWDELREQGFPLPKDPDDLSEDAVESLVEQGLVPERVYVYPYELLRMLKKDYPEQYAGVPLPEPKQGAWLDKDMLQPIFIFRQAEKDVRMTSLGPSEAFTIWIKAAVITGLIITSPWIFYQIWAFVAAGLYPHEKKYVHIFLPFSLGLFFAGAALAFFFVFAPVLKFLFMFNSMMGITPDLRITEWLSFVLILPLGFGISFQLPLVMLFLERIGVFDVHAYLSKWRIAILAIAVMSMMLTPADPTSMLLMAIPLTFLYFAGILLCKWMPRNKSPFNDDLDDKKRPGNRPKKDAGNNTGSGGKLWGVTRVLLILLLVGGLFGWEPMKQARMQKAAVDQIEEWDGRVLYDYQVDSSTSPIKGAKPSGWSVLRTVLGRDFFDTVVVVDLAGSTATDEGLEYLESLTELRRLDLSGTRVTESAVGRLQAALPRQCKIILDAD